MIELLVVVLIILVIAVDSKFLEGKNIGKRIQRRFLRSANQHTPKGTYSSSWGSASLRRWPILAAPLLAWWARQPLRVSLTRY